MDTTHSYLSSWFCEPANWFDNFFADDRAYEEGITSTKVRWRNDIVFSENASPEHVGSISARIRLPKISKRLKLVFESEEDEALNNAIPDSADNAKGTLGFLYDFIDSQKANLSLRLRFTPSITLRYRYTHPVNETLIIRFIENIYREEGHFGSDTRFDVEKAIDERNAFRWSNKVEIVEDRDGLEWVSALVLFHRINEKSAISYESSVTGVTRPYDLTTDYRLGVRFRRNFHRDWLFYELVPEVTWPKMLITDERHSVFAFIVSIEVFFETIK